MKKYTEIIKALREDNDLNQSDIAKIINTSQQQYSKYETEYAEIPVKAIIDLANYYNVSTDYLLGRVEFTSSLQDLDSFLKANVDIAVMLSEIKTLSKDSQKSVFEYVKLQVLKEKNIKQES